MVGLAEPANDDAKKMSVVLMAMSWFAVNLLTRTHYYTVTPPPPKNLLA